MYLKIHEFDMKLRYPFSISRHTYQSQPNMIVALHHRGMIGYGEATTNPYYHITIENLTEQFKLFNTQLENYVFTTPDQLFEDFSSCLSVNSFALAALNNASWDLYGKMHNSPVKNLIDLPAAQPPLTSYTLGIDRPEAMVQKMKDLPWPVYKIKLGTTDDLGLIRFIRKHTDAILRVDANCAWTADQTISLSHEFKKLGVEYIEQPLAAGSPGQKDSFERSVLPLFADESCCTESDVDICAREFHGINIKLLKCGGLSPAIRMIAEARLLGLEVMVGCMSETSVGISAAAQLLSFIDYADLDGPLLLAEDLAAGLRFEQGMLHTSNEPGLGIFYHGKH
ncbi:MAG: dipeptide epimerase [Cyclobacteriaceae bacterium]|nr:dipeptide epimerase [Cyclobacteriaceae bacterium]